MSDNDDLSLPLSLLLLVFFSSPRSLSSLNLTKLWEREHLLSLPLPI